MLFLPWWQIHRIHFKITAVTKPVSGENAQESGVAHLQSPCLWKGANGLSGLSQALLAPTVLLYPPLSSNKVLLSCPERAISGKRGLWDCSALSAFCFLWLNYPVRVPWINWAISFHGVAWSMIKHCLCPNPLEGGILLESFCDVIKDMFQ